jgi:HPt (histidine-containing phosphotransfer) domain-containing protein/two-component sensor histidine kinase
MGTQLWKGYLTVMLVAIGGYGIAPQESWMATIWQTLIGWTAAIFVGIGVRQHRPDCSWAWRLFGIGIFLNSSGILVAAILERIFLIKASPSAADALWLSIFPCLVIGLAMIILRRTPERDWSTLVDTVIITTSLCLLSWVFLIRPEAAGPEITMLDRFTVVAYPVGDLVVLGLMIRLLLGEGSRNPAFRFMVAALLCFLGSDVGWAIVNQTGGRASRIPALIMETSSLVGSGRGPPATLHPSVREVAKRALPRPVRLSRPLLGGLTVASLGSPALLAYEALRHQIHDAIAIAASSTVLFLLVVVRMAQLMSRIEERTRELATRNAAVRLVLDTINDGLLRVSRTGQLGAERSAVVDRWFEPFTESTRFVDWIRSFDREFADAFAISHEALVECAFTPELHLAQMPTELRAKGRHFRVSYLPLGDDATGARAPAGGDAAGAPGALLLVIKDETEQRLLAQHEAEQKELLALFEQFTRDRVGLTTFVREATEIVEQVVAGTRDLPTQRRLIHTLKGNASLMGLPLIAGLCHQTEDAMTAEPNIPPPTLPVLHERWRSLEWAFEGLIGERGHDVIEVETQEIEETCQKIVGGLPTTGIVRRLSGWRCEPIERPLQRLGKHAQALAQRLGKGDVTIEVQGAAVSLDPGRWAPLWSEMVHVVNNAVDHGFETPAERSAAGKASRPRLLLSAQVDGSHFAVEVRDDGRGIDWDAVSRSALAHGLATNGEDDLTAALFASGVSSRATVSVVSGRGIGMGAVRERVRQFGGEITLSSQRGAGTCWHIAFPLASLQPHESAEPGPGPLLDQQSGRSRSSAANWRSSTSRR